MVTGKIDSNDPLKGFAPVINTDNVSITQSNKEQTVHDIPVHSQFIRNERSEAINKVFKSSPESFSIYAKPGFKEYLPGEKDIYLKLYNKLHEMYPALITELMLRQKIDNLKDLLMAAEVYYLLSSADLINFLNKQLKNSNLPTFIELHEFRDCRSYNFNRVPTSPNLSFENCGYYFLDYNESALELALVTNPFTDYNNTVNIVYSGISVVSYFILPYQELEIEQSKISPINLKTQPRFQQKLVLPSVWLKRILYDALDCHATDIHIENHMIPETNPDSYDKTFLRSYTVSFRILTKIVEKPKWAMDKDFNDYFLQEIVKCTDSQIIELDSTKGVKATWLNVLQDGLVNLRLAFSSVDTKGNYTCVIRIQQLSIIPKEIQSLGFNSPTVHALQDLAMREDGLTLVAGPRGSGKNTTVNALVKYKREQCPGLSYYEYSSPIEFIQPFPQVDYNDSREKLQDYISLSKKQDVNVAVMNEIPDAGVAPAVADLINSSIAVITTLHINRIWDLPSKMKEYFGDNYMELYSHITGVVQQHMFVPICKHCARQKFFTKDTSPFPAHTTELMDRYGINKYYVCENPKGCIKCHGTGLDSHVQPFAEFLIFTEDIKDKLLNCKSIWEMSNYIKKEVRKSQTTLEDSIAQAVRDGVLTPLAFEKLK